MSSSTLTTADIDDPDAKVSATVMVTGSGTTEVSIVGQAATAEQLLLLAAKSFGVQIQIDTVAIVANGSPASADTELSGTQNLLASAPRVANG